MCEAKSKKFELEVDHFYYYHYYYYYYYFEIRLVLGRHLRKKLARKKHNVLMSPLQHWSSLGDKIKIQTDSILSTGLLTF